MCGIVGYVGKRTAQNVLLNGLKRLEYRGYDSAGIATLDDNNNPHIARSVGKIAELENVLLAKPHDGHLGRIMLETSILSIMVLLRITKSSRKVCLAINFNPIRTRKYLPR